MTKIWSVAMEGLGMRKHFKSLKRYNPVRVTDPSGQHITRVNPRQGVYLVLRKPQKYDYVDDNAEYEITFNKDLFYFISKTVNKKDQIVYHIGQKYDLTNWTEISEIFLGEVHISIVGNTHPEKDQCRYDDGYLGIYHVPGCIDAANNLTAVNPDGCTAKMESSRILEIVCFEPSWQTSEQVWKLSIEDFEVGKEGICVKSLAQYGYLTKMGGEDKFPAEGFSVLPRHRPMINCQADEKNKALFGKEMPKPTKAHHFWFAFSPDSQKKISSLKNGNYICSRITITGSALIDGTLQSTKRELILMLSKHGKPVPSSQMFPSRVTQIKDEKPYQLRRHYDKNRCLMQNPGATESIDFFEGYEDCSIEIAKPREIWPLEPEDAKWDVVYDDAIHGDKFISIVPLSPLEREGVHFQKFRIEKRVGQDAPKSLGNSGDFLGAIKINYPPKHNFSEANKRIALWYQQEKKHKHVHKTVYNCAYSSYTNGHFKQGLGWYNEPKFCTDLKIEEISSKSLADKASTVKLYYSSPNYSNYSDTESQYQNFDKNHYGIAVKKKTGDGSSGQTTLLGEKGAKSGSKNVSTSNPTRSITGTPDPIILYNPAHMQEVTILPDQEVIIRLSPPDELLIKQDQRDKCKRELWTINPMAVADTKPLVHSHTIVEVAQDRYKQEARIKADVCRLPSAAGRHNAGAVRIECSAISRVIRIYVKKEATPPLLPIRNALKFMDDFSCHEASGKKYLLAKSWKHGAGVKLLPHEVLYVPMPPIQDGYSDWNVQLLQHGVPLAVWENMPDKLKDIVDRHRPWYTKDDPVFMKNTMVFKPLEEAATGMLPELLDAVRSSGLKDYLPIMTLVCESFKTQITQDESGIVETRTKMIREFTICVNLRENNFTRIIYKPIDGMEQKCNRGDVLSVNLDSKEGTPHTWSCCEHPSFVSVQDQKSIPGNDNFIFGMTGRGSGILKFKSKDKMLTILLNVS